VRFRAFASSEEIFHLGMERRDFRSELDSAEKPLAFDFESDGAIFLLIKL
jgi:hypothetical protein